MDLLTISKILGISPELLRWPTFLKDFLIPLILLSVTLYLITKKIFRAKIINAVLAGCISLFTIVIIGPGRFFLPFISIFVLCTQKIKGRKGFFIGVLLSIAYYFLISFLFDTLGSL